MSIKSAINLREKHRSISIEELKACSDIVNMLDAKMLSLNEEVQALPKVGVEEQHEENVRMQKMWEENKIVDKLQKK